MANLTIIPDNTFRGCTKLQHITIPDSITTIGNGVFYQCDLENITIPQNVTSIGSNAFKSNVHMTQIVMDGDTPPTIGQGTFDDTNECPIYVPLQMVQEYVNDWKSYAHRIEGRTVEIPDGIYFTDKVFEQLCLDSFDINKDGYLTIDEIEAVFSIPQTFKNSGIKSPDFSLFTSVTSLSNLDGNSLISIKLPPNLKTIGGFESSKIGNITIPDTVTKISDNAFKSTDIKSIRIPSSVTEIGNSAFQNLTLQSVDIPDSVTKIGSFAFADDTTLRVINMNSNMPPVLGDNAFANVAMDFTIYVPDGYGNVYRNAVGWSNYASRIREYNQVDEEPDTPPTPPHDDSLNVSFNDVVFKEILVRNNDKNNDGEISVNEVLNITSIEDYWKNNTNIEWAELNKLPNLITTDAAFQNAVNLKKVDFGNLISLGAGTFSNCSSLSFLELPISLKYIEYGAIYNCQNLKGVTINGNISSIGTYALANCNKLKYIIVTSDTPAILGNDAFYRTNECPIYVPDEFVDSYILAWSPYRTRIRPISQFDYQDEPVVPPPVDPSTDVDPTDPSTDIPDPSTDIPDPSTDIPGEPEEEHDYTVEDLPEPKSNEIYYVSYNGRIITPNTSYNSQNCFNATLVSNTYGQYGKLSFNKPLEWMNNVFTDRKLLMKIKLPSTLTVLQGSNFSGCTNLKSVNLDNIIKLGQSDFYEALDIKKLVFSTSLKSIPKQCFRGVLDAYTDNGTTDELHGFETVVLPEGLEYIEEDAFRLNPKLKYVAIPNTVKKIGYRAFHTEWPVILDKNNSPHLYHGVENIGLKGGCFYMKSKYPCQIEHKLNMSSLGPADNSDTFYEYPIYVPDDAVDTYKSEWSRLATRIRPISSYMGERPLTVGVEGPDVPKTDVPDTPTDPSTGIPDVGEPYLEIVTTGDEFNDTDTISIGYRQNEFVEHIGDWSVTVVGKPDVNILGDTVQISDSKLTFLKHFEGSIRVNLNGGNVVAHKELLISCNEQPTYKYQVTDILTIPSSVSATTTSATVRFTGQRIAEYPLKNPQVIDSQEYNHTITFEANTSFTQRTLSGHITWNNIEVPYSLVQGGAEAVVTETTYEFVSITSPTVPYNATEITFQIRYNKTLHYSDGTSKTTSEYLNKGITISANDGYEMKTIEGYWDLSNLGRIEYVGYQEGKPYVPTATLEFTRGDQFSGSILTQGSSLFYDFPESEVSQYKYYRYQVWKLVPGITYTIKGPWYFENNSTKTHLSWVSFTAGTTVYHGSPYKASNSNVNLSSSQSRKFVADENVNWLAISYDSRYGAPTVVAPSSGTIEPIISIGMMERYGDASDIELVCSKTETVKGDVHWYCDLDYDVAQIIDDRILRFVSHYTGPVTVTARTENASKDFTFIVECAEVADSYEYSVANVTSPIVDYNVTNTTIYFDGTTVTHYPMKDDTTETHQYSQEVTFDANLSFENEATRTGSFTWNGQTVNWTVIQRKNTATLKKTEYSITYDLKDNYPIYEAETTTAKLPFTGVIKETYSDGNILTRTEKLEIDVEFSANDNLDQVYRSGEVTWNGATVWWTVILRAAKTHDGYAPQYLNDDTAWSLLRSRYGKNTGLDTNGVTEFPNDLFKDNKEITVVDLRMFNKCTKISNQAFSGCSNLKKIVFPPNLQEIGSKAFYGNYVLELTSLSWPNSLRTIGSSAFGGAAGRLTADPSNILVLPEGLETIGNCAFYDRMIECIDVPSTVTWIGYRALNSRDIKRIKLRMEYVYNVIHCEDARGWYNSVEASPWFTGATAIDVPSTSTTATKVYLKNSGTRSDLLYFIDFAPNSYFGLLEINPDLLLYPIPNN